MLDSCGYCRSICSLSVIINGAALFVLFVPISINHSFASAAAAEASQHVYLVLLNQAPPVVHLFDQRELSDAIDMPGEYTPEKHAAYLTEFQDDLLEGTLTPGTYRKLYSYSHLINGFSVLMSEEQAAVLEKTDAVWVVERDDEQKRFRKQTTYTPSYLGLPDGAWASVGGAAAAGEDVVIGFVDTGIDPTHPSFSDNSTTTDKPYPNVTRRYTGSCDVAAEFPLGSCNRKLVGARFFAAAAIASGLFNATIDFASPLDADGHGTHTASTAAGNNGVEVIVDGLSFGFASGMAPRAQIAVYKALYYGLGGFMSDVVAAIEQAVKDKVDILSLSIGPGGPPTGIATYLSVFDMALLSATRAGVFVAQAAGNAGPARQSELSFAPWICSVAAAVTDRTYPNSMLLGNNLTIHGIGLAAGTPGNDMYDLISAADALGSRNISAIDECQNSSVFDREMTSGKLLICSYTLNFFFGVSSLSKVVGTVMNLSAVGVVLIPDAILNGLNIPITPFPVPAIIVSTQNDSKTVLDYYSGSTTSTAGNATTTAATARLMGGSKAQFSKTSPMVASFSSRGPDTEDAATSRAGDVLKPNVMAPGSMIWAAWSAVGLDSAQFQGQRFAMISGTSMATPHIAGIAALVKQLKPSLSPAALASALTTTAFVTDARNGQPLLAQNPFYNTSLATGQATPFDFGAGAVNATGAIDPGLVFDAEFEDYARFLCTIAGAPETVKNLTGFDCDGGGGATTRVMGSDLNLPSITIANLTGSRSIPRKVLSVAAATETYTASVVGLDPTVNGVSITIDPLRFTIAPGDTQAISVGISPTNSTTRTVPAGPIFGYLLLSGSNSHTAQVPISIVTIP